MSAITPARVRLTGRERLILLVLLGAGFMLAVDFSILNVAFPDIGAGVGIGREALPWISTAYMLPAAGFTLVFGRLGDLVGRRRLFLGGIALLIVASLLGGFAGSAGPLLTARVLQGFATAMATPAALSLLTSTFAEGAARDRALGLNGALLSGGFTVGAMVGGSLVSLLSWRAAFFINVPVAALILAVAPALLVEPARSGRARLDLPGAVTVTCGLLAGTYAIIEKNWIAGTAAVLLLAAFAAVERRAAAPLVPIPVLRRPTVAWGNAGGLVAFTMEPAMIFLLTLYLQGTLGLSPLATGFVLGVPGLASVGAGIVAGRFIGRHGARRVLTAGLTVQALATLPLLLAGPGRWALAVLIPALFVGFFGHVSAIVAYTVTGTSGLPDDEQGLATGLTLMTQQVAITAGIPILSAVAAVRGGEIGGMHLAFAVDVAVTLAGAALIRFGLRPRGVADQGPEPDSEPGALVPPSPETARVPAG